MKFNQCFNFLLMLLLTVCLGSTTQAQSPVTVQNASANACDGTATLVDSTAIVSSITWYLNNGTMPQGVTTITNLCPGTYVVVYAYYLNPATIDSISVTFTVSGTGGGTGCSGLIATVNATDARDSVSCDGTVTASANGGTSPYSYTWNNLATVANQTSLCPGSYCVTVTDANGCVTSACANVSTIAGNNTPGDTLVIVNGSCGGVISMGTLIGTTNDCNLVYSLVTSGSMTSSTSFFPDSVQTVWSVFDSLGNILATYNVTYNFPLNTNAGCYDLILAISCDTSLRRSGTNPTILIQDALNVTPSSLTQFENSDVNIVNPITNNQLQILTESKIQGQITLTDIQGRVVYQTEVNDSSNISLDVNHLPAGIYVVKIQNGDRFTSRKITKM